MTALTSLLTFMLLLRSSCPCNCVAGVVVVAAAAIVAVFMLGNLESNKFVTTELSILALLNNRDDFVNLVLRNGDVDGGRQLCSDMLFVNVGVDVLLI